MKHHWWATPVWEIETGFDQTFNSELLREISSYTENSKQATGVWNCKSPRTLYLKEYILNTVRGYASECLSESFNFAPVLTAGWIHEQHPGESLALHDHGGTLIACSYYISAPPNSGNLLLVDPRGSINWDFTKEKYQRIVPRPSKLVIFPAYVMHMVEINKSQKTRISLGCNVSSTTL